jgi:hypothetical protein
MFREFKRHYHKVAKVYETMADKGGSFNLQIKFDGNNLRAENKTPNEEETVRFVVLMRRFLSPLDSLYYKKVWAILQEQYASEISDEISGRIETLFDRLDRGHLGININGDDLTAERIYQTLADGEYFDNNEKARTYLQSFVNVRPY